MTLTSCKYFSFLTVSLLLLGCTPGYDESNLLSDSMASECLKGSSYNRYDVDCDGRSIMSSGFVQETPTSNEIEVGESDPDIKGSKSNRTSYFLEPEYKPSLYTGSKIEFRGVLDGTSFTGKASIANAKVKTIALSEPEKRARDIQTRNEALGRERHYIHAAYWRCADSAMAIYKGSECPKPPDAGGMGSLQQDGGIKIQGVCFFSSQSIVMECESNPTGTRVKITSFDVK